MSENMVVGRRRDGKFAPGCKKLPGSGRKKGTVNRKTAAKMAEAVYNQAAEAMAHRVVWMGQLPIEHIQAVTQEFVEVLDRLGEHGVFSAAEKSKIKLRLYEALRPSHETTLKAAMYVADRVGGRPGGAADGDQDHTQQSWLKALPPAPKAFKS